jgi:urease accessory protein
MHSKAKNIPFYAGLWGLPALADAHPFHPFITDSVGFVAGLCHPISSAEHFLLLLILGFWLAQFRRTMAYALPLVLVALMLVGGAANVLEWAGAGVDLALLPSLMLLGLMMVCAYQVSWPLGVVLGGGLALMHGYAHAQDMLLDAEATRFTAGFVWATTALLYVGLGIGRVSGRLGNNAQRLVGGMAAVTGVWLANLA